MLASTIDSITKLLERTVTANFKYLQLLVLASSFEILRRFSLGSFKIHFLKNFLKRKRERQRDSLFRIPLSSVFPSKKIFLLLWKEGYPRKKYTASRLLPRKRGRGFPVFMCPNQNVPADVQSASFTHSWEQWSSSIVPGEKLSRR